MLTSPEEVRDWLPGEWPLTTLEGTRRKVTCLIHVPASTLLRAQDRSSRAPLRSAERPWGANTTHSPVWFANNLVRNIRHFIQWAARRDVLVVLANPPDSYLWPLVGELEGEGAPPKDFDLCLCMFGSPARGALRLRVYGELAFTPLSRVCYRTPTGWACGNRLHAQSGFADGASPPSAARALTSQFARRFAGVLAQWALTPHESAPPDLDVWGHGQPTRRSR